MGLFGKIGSAVKPNPSKTRKFDGKTYTRWAVYDTKTRAKKAAKDFRNQHSSALARVVKEDGSWAVYHGQK